MKNIIILFLCFGSLFAQSSEEKIESSLGLAQLGVSTNYSYEYASNRKLGYGFSFVFVKDLNDRVRRNFGWEYNLNTLPLYQRMELTTSSYVNLTKNNINSFTIPLYYDIKLTKKPTSLFLTSGLYLNMFNFIKREGRYFIYPLGVKPHPGLLESNYSVLTLTPMDVGLHLGFGKTIQINGRDRFLVRATFRYGIYKRKRVENEKINRYFKLSLSYMFEG